MEFFLPSDEEDGSSSLVRVLSRGAVTAISSLSLTLSLAPSSLLATTTLSFVTTSSRTGRREVEASFLREIFSGSESLLLRPPSSVSLASFFRSLNSFDLLCFSAVEGKQRRQFKTKLTLSKVVYFL